MKLVDRGGELWLSVRAKPRAHKSRILEDGPTALVIALAAPPVDGAANAALCELLAKRLGVAKGRVRVLKGTTSAHKVVSLEGVTVEHAREALKPET